jgi:hypothetical protein
MNKILSWNLKRHPFLYKIRFKLISKDSPLDRIESYSYNEINKKKDIPNIYFKLNNSIFSDNTNSHQISDIEKAMTIAIWLRNTIKGGSGLSKSSEVALKKMVCGNGGICSDIVQVFNNFCVINDIKVKEWGLKIFENNILQGGHSFNEIYSKELKKWIIIDVSKSIFFYTPVDDTPLSVFDLISLKKEKKKITFSSFNPRFDIQNKNISKNYLITNSYPFLITNYHNRVYDYFLKKLDFFPVFMIHAFLFTIGQYYVYEFPINTNLKLKNG